MVRSALPVPVQNARAFNPPLALSLKEKEKEKEKENKNKNETHIRSVLPGRAPSSRMTPTNVYSYNLQ